MGDDDAVCDQAPDRRHDFVLDAVIFNGSGRGAATADVCGWCGVPAYEASATDR